MAGIGTASAMWLIMMEPVGNGFRVDRRSSAGQASDTRGLTRATAWSGELRLLDDYRR